MRTLRPTHSTPAPRPSASDLAEQLCERGFGIVENFIDMELVEGLVADARALWEDGAFEYARVGTGAERQLCPAVRSDRIHWIDPLEMTASQTQYANKLEELRLEVNRQTMLGLFEWEGHLAIYPPDTFYRRHLDVFRDARQRKVSVILYLNQRWTPIDGGELRLYLDGPAMEPFLDVAPCAGTLVIFLSEQFYHEVLQSHDQRMSITGWFRVRSM